MQEYIFRVLKKTMPRKKSTKRSRSPKRASHRRRRTSRSRKSARPSPGHRGYFRRGSTLGNKQKKFCSCIAKVSRRRRRSGKRTNNPYAVCAKTTGTSVGSRHGGCLSHYNFSRNSKLSNEELSNITKNESKAFRNYSRHRSRKRRSPKDRSLKGPSSNRQRSPKSRSQMLRALQSLVKSKY